MEFEDRASTSSSFSGIYRNILQSPAPICMYYFSHPFGISTPQNRKQELLSTGKSIKTPNKHNNLQNLIIHNNKRRCIETELRLTPLIPWPRDIWSRQDYDLPPLLQILAQKNGHQLPDIETIIKTVRNAWNTPNIINKNYNNYNMSLTKSNLDIFNNTNNNNKIVINNKKLINKNYLLKRRYSVPEIIMRKHSIDQLKINENITINEETYFTKVNSIVRTTKTATTAKTSLKSSSSTSSSSSSRSLKNNNNNNYKEAKEIYTNLLIEKEPEIEKELSQNCINVEIIENVEEDISNNNIEIHLNNYENIDSNTTTVEITGTSTILPTATSTATLNNNSTTTLTTTEIENENETETETEIKSPIKVKNKNFNKIKLIEDFLENKSDLYLDEFISNLLINNLNNSNEIIDKATLKKNITKEIPSPPETPIELIKVTTGSCYNLNNLLEPIFITRYSAMPRTLSMEVDIPSTTPSFADDDDYYDFLINNNKNRNYNNMIHDKINYYINNSHDYIRNYNMINNNLEDDDGSLSLIDSLDDPLSPRYNNNDPIIPNTMNKKDTPVKSPNKCDKPVATAEIREETATTIGAEVGNEQNELNSIINNKNEAFFISMQNDDNDINNLQPPTPIEQIAYNVANIMPFKLRNKLQQRYNDINIKKEFNNHQKHIVFDIIGLDDDPPLSINNKRKTITTIKTTNITNKIKTKPIPNNLSLLESYTIDSKGNMKFTNPDNKRDGKITLKKNQQSSTASSVSIMSSAQRTTTGSHGSTIVIKKPINNKLNTEFMAKKSQPQVNKVLHTPLIKKQEHPPQQQSTIINNNKQKLIRSQQIINEVHPMTTQNNLTPDIECGPHRFYHKTEIKDGEKSIEILEIVECNIDQNGRKDQTSKPIALKQQKHQVKVQKLKSQDMNQQQTQLNNENIKSKIPIPVSCVINRTPNNNNKMQLTTKNLMNYQQYHSPIKLQQHVDFSPSPPEQQPMQRSGNLTKFHFFDVIPEERSSVSVDSSNDDLSSLIINNNNNGTHVDSNSPPDNLNSNTAEEEQEEEDVRDAETNNKILENQGDNNEEEDELSQPNTINDVTNNLTPSSLSLSTISDYNLSLNSFNSDFNKQIIHKNYDNNNILMENPTLIEMTPISTSSTSLTTTTATSVNTLTPSSLILPNAPLSTTTTTTLLLSSTMTTTTTTTSTTAPSNDDNKNIFDYLTKINYCNDCIDNKTTNDNIWLVPDNNNLIINNKKKIIKSTKKLLLNNNNNYNYNKNKIHSKSNFNENQIICHNLESYDQTKMIKHVEQQQEHKLLQRQGNDDNDDCKIYETNEKLLLLKQNELNCNLIKSKTYEVNDESLCMYCNINCHQNDYDNYDNNVIICKLCKKLHNNPDTNVYNNNGTTASPSHFLDTNIDNKLIIKRPKHLYNLPRRCSIKSINKIIKDDIIIPKTKSGTTFGQHKNNKFIYYNKLKTIKQNIDQYNNSNNSYDDTSTSISPIQTESIDSDYEFYKRNKNLKQKYIVKHEQHKQQQQQQELEKISKKKKNGWSVTVAGNYNTKIIPNVQMHLSFPSSNSNSNKKSKVIKQNNNYSNNNFDNDDEDIIEDTDDAEQFNKIISINNNSTKHNRSLIKTENLNLPKMYDAKPEMCTNNNNNNNNNNITSSNSKKLIKLNKTKSQQQQHKKIKSVECSLAMTSATTKTLTNINNHRRRTMSVHTFNTTESLKNRKKLNDQSFDYSEVSSRRLSIDSQTPIDASMNLSILGNSIAPEEKPRVPTMSERDLTRNLNGYFVRNRSQV